MASLASIKKVPKGYKSLSDYLDAEYAWEQKQGPDRTTAFDGSVRTEVSDKQPTISEKLFQQGYQWVATGEDWRPGDERFGGGGGGDRSLPGSAKATKWSLLQRAPAAQEVKASASTSKPAEAATSNPQARFTPSQELKDRASAVNALERAQAYQKKVNAAKDAASPRFREAGGGIFAEVASMGQRALEGYDFAKRLAEQKSLLGIQEVGESLGFSLGRLRSDLSLPRTWDVGKYLDTVKRFQGLVD